jgi:hypothetical protein
MALLVYCCYSKQQGQVKMIKIQQKTPFAVSIDVDENILDCYNQHYAARNDLVFKHLSRLCPNGTAGIYSTTINIEPDSKQGRYVERYFLLCFHDADCINSVISDLVDDLMVVA